MEVARHSSVAPRHNLVALEVAVAQAEHLEEVTQEVAWARQVEGPSPVGFRSCRLPLPAP